MSNQYNNHVTFLAEIASAILNGNRAVLDVNGVSEIIALYLMIPYMSRVTLRSPDEGSCMPKLTGDFCKGISIHDLRDTISHSFVTIEEDDGNPDSKHGKVLVFDDRAFYNGRTEHENKGYHGSTCEIPIGYVHDRLMQMAEEVIKNRG